MQRHKIASHLASIFAIGALGAIGIAAARADDSTASLDADGLHFTYNPDIKFETEDLFLSRTQVRVVNRFRNTSAHDISTLVAFPVPAMEIGEGGNYALQGRDPVNIMDFQVAADGRRIDPKVEIKATRFGVDVTDILKKYAIPLTMLTKGEGDKLRERLDDMPADARHELERYGLVDWNSSFGANNKPLATVHWQTHIAFYWFQTFPTGHTVELTHSYRPVPRQFFVTAEELASPANQKTYCIDACISAGGTRRHRARAAEDSLRL